MKKLLFTAIAMVAFSSASMANTIADAKKDNIIKNKKEIKTNDKSSLVKRGLTFCQIIGTLASNDVFIATGNTNAATQAGITAQLNCILAGG